MLPSRGIQNDEVSNSVDRNSSVCFSSSQTVSRIESCGNEGLGHGQFKSDAGQVHNQSHILFKMDIKYLQRTYQTRSVWVEIASKGDDDIVLNHLSSRRWLQTENVGSGGQKNGD